jgi:ribosomal protein S18 acetylase RimI-like enzyme
VSTGQRTPVPHVRTGLCLRPRAYDHSDARALQLALHAEQGRLYGFADHPDDLDASRFVEPHGLFLVGYNDSGIPIACGAWHWLTEHTAEIKRMYVAPAARRHGHARTLLAALEHHAAEAGARHLMLETGARNTSALALYAAADYQRIPSYVPHRNPQINRALTKTITNDEPYPTRHDRARPTGAHPATAQRMPTNT